MSGAPSIQMDDPTGASRPPAHGNRKNSMATACDAVLPKQPYAFTPLASLPTTAARAPTASTMTLATILIIESVLSKLNLLPSQLEALKVQGFITSERRRRRGLVYRLHFRMA